MSLIGMPFAAAHVVFALFVEWAENISVSTSAMRGHLSSNA